MPNLTSKIIPKKIKNFTFKKSFKNKKLFKKLHMPSPPYNNDFIQQLGLLEEFFISSGDKFRARAYHNAQEAIINYPNNINSVHSISNLKGIGKSVISKLQSYVDTGIIKDLIDYHSVLQFTKIYGVGHIQANQIIKQNITTIEQLKANPSKFLNKTQQIGLAYYDDLNKRIPRDEIDEYKQLFNTFFKNAQELTSSHDSMFDIAGSYRRGLLESGDIDVIVSNHLHHSPKAVFTQFIASLVEQNIILHKLTNGPKQIKILVICKLPNKPARRVDFMFSPPDEYPFALLYFTGSKFFNTAMRQRALDLGFTMNEHGMIDKSNKLLVTGLKTEKDIFNKLGMKFKQPNERINHLSIEVKPGVKPDVKPGVKPVVKPDVKPDVKHIKLWSQKDLIEFLEESNNMYHNGINDLTDNEYDELYDYAKTKFPNNSFFKQIGTLSKNKVKLPYNMPSMNKTKPNSKFFDTFKKKYTDPSSFVISCKLDGVSGLYVLGDTPALYTRGNGSVGQNISKLLPYLKLPSLHNGTVVRGEFIISKDNFKNYFANASNARNTVAGLINTINIQENLAYIDFVAYEVLSPILSPEKQMHFLQTNGFNTVLHKTVTSLSDNDLSQLLIQLKTDYKYQIDGIIITHNKIYIKNDGNPKHSVAFKINDQFAETTVVDILWNPSINGSLKPTIKFLPVKLGGVIIEKVSGIHALFIKTHKIGVGAKIVIQLSGGVIPNFNSVISSAPIKWPDCLYHWLNNDIVLTNPLDNKTVQLKTIVGFFKAIQVDDLGTGNVKKIIDAGYKHIHTIIDMNVDNYLSVDSFKITKAKKLHNNISIKVQEATLPMLMNGSNIWTHFNIKTFNLIISHEPDIITSTSNDASKIAKLNTIHGLGKPSAIKFVKHIPDFIKFIKFEKLDAKLYAHLV